MEITHRLHGIEFEWNKDKAESNSAKHGVDFETACEAFFDPFVMVLESEHHQREVRETLIGMTVHWKFLLCCLRRAAWRHIPTHFLKASNVSRETEL